MKPSDACKAAGLKGLAELSRLIGESVQTLNNWSKNKPNVFSAAVMWAEKMKGESVMATKTIELQKTVQGKKLEWETADDMSGWVAWLPEGVETETVTDAAGDDYEFISTRGGEFSIKTAGGKKWIKTGINGEHV